MVIAPIIVLAMVCLTVAFTMVGLSTFQLNASQQTCNSDQALYLAEGALAQTMSLLHSGLDPGQTQFGRAGETVTFPFPGSTPNGQVTFDTSQRGYSTNDFDGTQTAGWQGINVPAGMAMLLARGQVGNSVRLVQAFVDIPTYQYVLASDGPVQSLTTPLKLTADKDMGNYVVNVQNNTPNTVLPANLGANGNVSGASGSLVTGDVVSPDTVDLVPNSTIDGVHRAASVNVPHLQVTTFINNWLHNAGANPPAPNVAGSGETIIASDCYSSSDLDIPGDLVLGAGASLYVTGNLTVGGALGGVGQVFVNGSVQVGDGADLDAGNLVALVSTGDVTLQGPASAMKYFQGLVYCEGAFTASNITIVGAFAAAQSTESTSTNPVGVNLTNAPIVSIRTATQITEPNPLSLVSNIVGHPPNWYPGGIWTPASAGGLATSANAQTLYTAVAGTLGPQLIAFLTHGDFLSLTSTGVSWNGVDYFMLASYVQYDPAQNKFVPLNPPFIQYMAGVAPNMTPTTAAQFSAALVGTGCPTTLPNLLSLMQSAQNLFAQSANNILAAGSGSNAAMNLDLNSFLSNSNPLHVVSWRELPPN
ncbi:MAG TPA: hypothetical protein VGO93_06365 [Candidatus Xenobia bacterium]